MRQYLRINMGPLRLTQMRLGGHVSCLSAIHSRGGVLSEISITPLRPRRDESLIWKS